MRMPELRFSFSWVRYVCTICNAGTLISFNADIQRLNNLETQFRTICVANLLGHMKGMLIQDKEVIPGHQSEMPDSFKLLLRDAMDFEFPTGFSLKEYTLTFFVSKFHHPRSSGLDVISF